MVLARKTIQKKHQSMMKTTTGPLDQGLGLQLLQVEVGWLPCSVAESHQWVQQAVERT